MSQDSVEYAVGGPSGFLFLTGIRDFLFFSILQNAKTSSGAHPVSYLLGTVDSLPRIKAADL